MTITRDAIEEICETAAVLSGAEIGYDLTLVSERSTLRMWFVDLGKTRSPNILLRPSGLKRHIVELEFGNHARPTMLQMERNAPKVAELVSLFIASTQKYCEIECSQNLDEPWQLSSSEFSLKLIRKEINDPLSSLAFNFTCKKIVVPLIAALAELIGYEEIVPTHTTNEGELEGALLKEEVLRRERSRKNRLLALEFHGESCKVCGFEPDKFFDGIPSVLEIHHLTPLSVIDSPQRYSPVHDLVPLCPNCHRAIHKKSPIPYTIEELKRFLKEPIPE